MSLEIFLLTRTCIFAGARALNSCAIHGEDPIFPATNEAGELPGCWFPCKRSKLMSVDQDGLDEKKAAALIKFYNMSSSKDLSKQRAAIAGRLGVRL